MLFTLTRKTTGTGVVCPIKPDKQQLGCTGGGAVIGGTAAFVAYPWKHLVYSIPYSPYLVEE
jgi:hypothetical protein